MRILITGGAGFVGSNLATKLKLKYPQYEIATFDNLRRRGSEMHLSTFKKLGIEFVHGDLRNQEDLEQITGADLVIDAAAEPSVLAGIDSPVYPVITNNLIGTAHILEYCKRYSAGLIFLSTSRVYPIEKLESLKYDAGQSRFELNEVQPFPGSSAKGIAESFPLEGYRSYYGATKLASEILIEEYRQIERINTVINRCGVITGPGQMGKVDQGVVVLWVARHFWKGKLQYIGYGGEGKQVRDMLHINDLFRLVDHEIHHMHQLSGQVMNAGGGKDVSISLQELTQLCEQVVGNSIAITPNNTTRQADVPIYITDNGLVSETTGWKPEKTPKEIVDDIFEWMKENEKLLTPILN